jgi:2-polyprenyl-3-methyl-5-hydroxy-6-metoxy-1,4-benzoquinol methylase
MIPEYKKNIYSSWADKRTKTAPYPTESEILKQTSSYKKIIGNFLPKDKKTKILDLGCGYGYFLKACRDEGYDNLEGVDATSSFADSAKKIFNLTNISISDAFDFLKLGNKYDVITAFDVLEHIKKDEIVDFLSLMKEGLNDHGMLLFRVPNAESISGLYITYSDLTHETAFSRLLIGELGEVLGFHEIKIHPSFVTSNMLMRVAQKIIAKIFGLNDKFMFSSNIIAILKK